MPVAPFLYNSLIKAYASAVKIAAPFNPKAKKLLKDLADLNLIKINKEKSDFPALLKKLRTKSKDELSLEEITNEVEQVRKSRYE